MVRGSRKSGNWELRRFSLMVRKTPRSLPPQGRKRAWYRLRQRTRGWYSAGLRWLLSIYSRG